jgi:acyl-CoA thioesterase II
VDSMHAGRSWASDTVTAWQGDRLLSRALVLLNVDDPDLIRHQADFPSVPGPEEAEATEGLEYPGAELRVVDDPKATAPGGGPAMYFWTRYPDPVESVAANQAIVSWDSNGALIGLSMRPHTDVVDISQAHRTISTGVIGHTINFHERIDASQWLLFALEGTYAGRGRIHGRGSVFTQAGKLVATFSQDSMVKGIEGTLDPKRAM